MCRVLSAWRDRYWPVPWNLLESLTWSCGVRMGLPKRPEHGRNKHRGAHFQRRYLSRHQLEGRAPSESNGLHLKSHKNERPRSDYRTNRLSRVLWSHGLWRYDWAEEKWKRESTEYHSSYSGTSEASSLRCKLPRGDWALFSAELRGWRVPCLNNCLKHEILRNESFKALVLELTLKSSLTILRSLLNHLCSFIFRRKT